MALTKIKKGLKIPITGEPQQIIHNRSEVKSVALIGYDYVGMKPTFQVAVGDKVKLGQLLFIDKKMAGVKYTSPGSGKISAINRGAKRVFESIIIELSGNDELTFTAYKKDKLSSLTCEKVQEQLIESGLWTSFRARPFGKVADPEQSPHSIFITAMDTNPLAPNMAVVISGKEEDFNNGLKVIAKLTSGKLFLCKSPIDQIATDTLDQLQVEEFYGPHPAGNAGTHIHFLDPVNKQKTVWHISAQEVIAIGLLFTTGKISVDRIVSLAGPLVKNPRLIRTRLGACITDIISGELIESTNRAISGSVISGRTAFDTIAYLGRYHQQVSVLSDRKDRKFFGWLSPGLNQYSFKKILLSKLLPGKTFNFQTLLNGGKRSVFPIGSYEDVMPLDILPTFLLRSLLVDDVEEAEKLGCLELIEEDLALCSFVSPAKIEYGSNLRRNLTIIEKEG